MTKRTKKVGITGKYGTRYVTTPIDTRPVPMDKSANGLATNVR